MGGEGPGSTQRPGGVHAGIRMGWRFQAAGSRSHGRAAPHPSGARSKEGLPVNALVLRG